MPRKAISKKTRFEVFKRDSFTCQYCGESSPKVVLHIDHIKPVKEGGDNSIINLITSCLDCNLGKGARELSDESAINKQKAQLDALQEKREQMELMVKWHKSLANIEQEAINVFSDYWSSILNNEWSLNNSGTETLKKLLKKHGLQELLQAADTSVSQYIKREDDYITKESVELAFSKIAGIIRNKNRPDYDQQAYYIRGILRNRFSNSFNERTIVQDIVNAHLELDFDMDEIAEYAKSSRSISQFKAILRGV